MVPTEGFQESFQLDPLRPVHALGLIQIAGSIKYPQLLQNKLCYLSYLEAGRHIRCIEAEIVTWHSQCAPSMTVALKPWNADKDL